MQCFIPCAVVITLNKIMPVSRYYSSKMCYFEIHGYSIVAYLICKQNIEHLERSLNLHVKFAAYLEAGNRFMTTMYMAIRL